MVLCAACSTDEILYQTVIPGTSSAATIERIAERWDYLDVEIETAGRKLRFFLPADRESCRVLAGAGSAAAAAPTGLVYANLGVLGRLKAGELECEPIGILSLEEWRDRRPRGSREPIPRSRSTYTLVQRDADVALLRGRFGLAGELGWAGGADTIAVVPVTPDCEPLIADRHASLEFRPAGPEPLVLLGSGAVCPLLGLVRPQPG